MVLFKQKLLSYIIVRSKLPGAYTLPISQTRDPRAPFEWMKKQSTGLIRLFPLFYLLGFVIVVIGLAKFFTLPDQRGIPIARAIFLYSVAFPFGYFYLNRNSIKTSWDLRHLKMISLTFIAAGYFVLRKLIF